MNAQLAAAEHLSGCLSEQMAVLSIASSGKENDVKKKLFEFVGLSYNSDSCRSPDGNRTFYTHSHREQFTVSGSIASITQSVRNQANPQYYEPETARRHQYSLDRVFFFFCFLLSWFFNLNELAITHKRQYFRYILL